jgi:hypothetical protein
MWIKVTTLIALFGATGLLLEVPFASSESFALVIWGGALLVCAGALRLSGTSRRVTEPARVTLLSGHPGQKGMLSLVGSVQTARNEGAF